MKSGTILLLSLGFAGFATAAAANIDVRIDTEIRIGRALPPPPPEVVFVEEVGPPGPPPWPRPRWYRKSYSYYYYPGYDVYYRPTDKVWFYLDGGNWRYGARLPEGIRVDFGRSVSLRLESNRPYRHHREVASYYPPTYWSKVRFKDRHDNRFDRRDDRRDNRVDRRGDRRDDRNDRRGDRGRGRGRDR